ncbi:MAG: hypothetical protein OXI27_00385 [Thaumarchaeota archaeon]|nr:hypothetical protein [Nitrososphaerota archaeon]
MKRLRLLGWGLVASSAWFLWPWAAVAAVSLWSLVTRGETGGSGTPSVFLLLSIIVGVTLLGSGLLVLYRSGNRRPAS